MPVSFRPFRRLQWQLSFSYLFVTVSALLAVELALVGGGLLLLNSSLLPNLMVQALRQQFVPQIRPYLDQPTPDLQGLDNFLGAYNNSSPNQGVPVGGEEGFLLLNRRAELLWSSEMAEGQVQPGQTLPGQTLQGADAARVKQSAPGGAARRARNPPPLHARARRHAADRGASRTR